MEGLLGASHNEEPAIEEAGSGCTKMRPGDSYEEILAEFGLTMDDCAAACGAAEPRA